MMLAKDGIHPQYRSTSMMVHLGAALSGYALAALPCYVADAQSGLERVLPEKAVFELSYWLAVHEDLAGHPRVRTVMDAIEAHVARDRALFRPACAYARADHQTGMVHRLFEPAQTQAPMRASWPSGQAGQAGGLRALPLR
jgi:hypothetical protein